MNIHERQAQTANRRTELLRRLNDPIHQAATKEARERIAVVQEALCWENTPVESGGRVKGAGADCAFFAEVFRACGVFSSNLEVYNADWFCHKDKERYLRAVLKHSIEVFGEGAHAPGNIVLGKALDCFWHGALIISWPRIIQGYPPRVAVGDIRLMVPFSGCQQLRCFNPWGRKE